MNLVSWKIPHSFAMNRLTLFFALLFPAIPAVTTGADQFVYLSAGDAITIYQIDSATGELSPFQKVELPGAGPMAVSPDKTLLYAVATMVLEDGEKASPALATYQVEGDGSLDFVEAAPANQRPGYLMADAKGNFLAGNHYGPGMVTIWKLNNGIYEGETVQEINLEPKAHSSVFSPNNRWLLVPATGPNKVFQLAFDATTGMTTPNSPPFAPGPESEEDARQPRHLVFHPSLPIVYTTNERERPGVGVWEWDASEGLLDTTQNIVTQPEGFDGDITTADLHLTPDAKFLYVSNRDVTDRKARTGEDSIVGFSVDEESGKLTMIGHFPCEHVPRSFALDETGAFAYVAGQGDDRLGAYEIDPETGELTKVSQYETGARPIWVHVMSPRP